MIVILDEKIQVAITIVVAAFAATVRKEASYGCRTYTAAVPRRPRHRV